MGESPGEEALSFVTVPFQLVGHQLKRILAREECLGRGSFPEKDWSIEAGRVRALQGRLAQSPPPTLAPASNSVSQQNRSRLEDAWCLTPRPVGPGTEGQGLGGVPDSGDMGDVKQRAGAKNGGLVLGVSEVSLWMLRLGWLRESARLILYYRHPTWHNCLTFFTVNIETARIL